MKTSKEDTEHVIALSGEFARNIPYSHRFFILSDRLTQTLIDIREDKFGDVQEKVEMTDVTTPATIIGFTNNWKGSFEGWLLTPETGFSQLPSTLPGLDHFYMCGHWVAVGGGLPTAMMSGRNTAQMICAQEHKRFEVREPEYSV